MNKMILRSSLAALACAGMITQEPVDSRDNQFESHADRQNEVPPIPRPVARSPRTF